MGWVDIYTCPIVLEILGLGSKQPMKLIVTLLDKVLKSGALRSSKLSKGNLLLLNGPKGVLEVKIARWRWLRGRARLCLTRSRSWLVGCRSNYLLITRYPIKVTSVKKSGVINIGKRQNQSPG